ncbi:MAG: PEP-CTERM sorting domain-containing protein [Acidobacteria bacterium]|nr:PEP-CTERM sorting domain-containing protein [Acidobacteriota bacterium]
MSTAGWGSVTNTGTITASVPVGSTVLAAYLYQSMYNIASVGVFAPGGTLNALPVAYGAPVINTSATFLASSRADVTGIVKPIIDAGPGGVYSFSITEPGGETGSTGWDGEALVVVYSNASLPTSTVGILDGFSAVGGDSSTITFASALDPTAAGFFAEMRLGIGYSCCSQKSTVKVNGVTITDNAGNNDDGLGSISNGQLITVGDYADPFSAMLPSYADDHERYNLVPQVTLGDVAISVFTENPSTDDNIFLEVFHVAGEATVVGGDVPEPSSVILLGTILAGLGYSRWRRKRA